MLQDPQGQGRPAPQGASPDPVYGPQPAPFSLPRLPSVNLPPKGEDSPPALGMIPDGMAPSTGEPPPDFVPPPVLPDDPAEAEAILQRMQDQLRLLNQYHGHAALLDIQQSIEQAPIGAESLLMESALGDQTPEAYEGHSRALDELKPYLAPSLHRDVETRLTRRREASKLIPEYEAEYKKLVDERLLSYKKRDDLKKEQSAEVQRRVDADIAKFSPMERAMTGWDRRVEAIRGKHEEDVRREAGQGDKPTGSFLRDVGRGAASVLSPVQSVEDEFAEIGKEAGERLLSRNLPAADAAAVAAHFGMKSDGYQERIPGWTKETYRAFFADEGRRLTRRYMDPYAQQMASMGEAVGSVAGWAIPGTLEIKAGAALAKGVGAVKWLAKSPKLLKGAQALITYAGAPAAIEFTYSFNRALPSSDQQLVDAVTQPERKHATELALRWWNATRDAATATIFSVGDLGRTLKAPLKAEVSTGRALRSALATGAIAPAALETVEAGEAAVAEMMASGDTSMFDVAHDMEVARGSFGPTRQLLQAIASGEGIAEAAIEYGKAAMPLTAGIGAVHGAVGALGAAKRKLESRADMLTLLRTAKVDIEQMVGDNSPLPAIKQMSAEERDAMRQAMTQRVQQELESIAPTHAEDERRINTEIVTEKHGDPQVAVAVERTTAKTIGASNAPIEVRSQEAIEKAAQAESEREASDTAAQERVAYYIKKATEAEDRGEAYTYLELAEEAYTRHSRSEEPHPEIEGLRQDMALMWSAEEEVRDRMLDEAAQRAMDPAADDAELRKLAADTEWKVIDEDTDAGTLRLMDDDGTQITIAAADAPNYKLHPDSQAKLQPAPAAKPGETRTVPNHYPLAKELAAKGFTSKRTLAKELEQQLGEKVSTYQAEKIIKQLVSDGLLRRAGKGYEYVAPTAAAVDAGKPVEVDADGDNVDGPPPVEVEERDQRAIEIDDLHRRLGQEVDGIISELTGDGKFVGSEEHARYENRLANMVMRYGELTNPTDPQAGSIEIVAQLAATMPPDLRTDDRLRSTFGMGKTDLPRIRQLIEADRPSDTPELVSPDPTRLVSMKGRKMTVEEATKSLSTDWTRAGKEPTLDAVGGRPKRLYEQALAMGVSEREAASTAFDSWSPGHSELRGVSYASFVNTHGKGIEVLHRQVMDPDPAVRDEGMARLADHLSDMAGADGVTAMLSMTAEGRAQIRRMAEIFRSVSMQHEMPSPDSMERLPRLPESDEDLPAEDAVGAMDQPAKPSPLQLDEKAQAEVTEAVRAKTEAARAAAAKRDEEAKKRRERLARAAVAMRAKASGEKPLSWHSSEGKGSAWSSQSGAVDIVELGRIGAALILSPVYAGAWVARVLARTAGKTFLAMVRAAEWPFRAAGFDPRNMFIQHKARTIEGRAAAIYDQRAGQIEGRATGSLAGLRSVLTLHGRPDLAHLQEWCAIGHRRALEIGKVLDDVFKEGSQASKDLLRILALSHAKSTEARQIEMHEILGRLTDQQLEVAAEIRDMLDTIREAVAKDLLPDQQERKRRLPLIRQAIGEMESHLNELEDEKVELQNQLTDARAKGRRSGLSGDQLKEFVAEQEKARDRATAAISRQRARIAKKREEHDHLENTYKSIVKTWGIGEERGGDGESYVPSVLNQDPAKAKVDAMRKGVDVSGDDELDLLNPTDEQQMQLMQDRLNEMIDAFAHNHAYNPIPPMLRSAHWKRRNKVLAEIGAEELDGVRALTHYMRDFYRLLPASMWLQRNRDALYGKERALTGRELAQGHLDGNERMDEVFYNNNARRLGGTVVEVVVEYKVNANDSKSERTVAHFKNMAAAVEAAKNPIAIATMATAKRSAEGDEKALLWAPESASIRSMAEKVVLLPSRRQKQQGGTLDRLSVSDDGRVAIPPNSGASLHWKSELVGWVSAMEGGEYRDWIKNAGVPDATAHTVFIEEALNTATGKQILTEAQKYGSYVSSFLTHNALGLANPSRGAREIFQQTIGNAMFGGVRGAMEGSRIALEFQRGWDKVQKHYANRKTEYLREFTPKITDDGPVVDPTGLIRKVAEAASKGDRHVYEAIEMFMRSPVSADAANMHYTDRHRDLKYGQPLYGTKKAGALVSEASWVYRQMSQTHGQRQCWFMAFDTLRRAGRSKEEAAKVATDFAIAQGNIVNRLTQPKAMNTWWGRAMRPLMSWMVHESSMNTRYFFRSGLSKVVPRIAQVLLYTWAVQQFGNIANIDTTNAVGGGVSEALVAGPMATWASHELQAAIGLTPDPSDASRKPPRWREALETMARDKATWAPKVLQEMLIRSARYGGSMPADMPLVPMLGSWMPYSTQIISNGWRYMEAKLLTGDEKAADRAGTALSSNIAAMSWYKAYNDIFNVVPDPHDPRYVLRKSPSTGATMDRAPREWAWRATFNLLGLTRMDQSVDRIERSIIQPIREDRERAKTRNEGYLAERDFKAAYDASQQASIAKTPEGKATAEKIAQEHQEAFVSRAKEVARRENLSVAETRALVSRWRRAATSNIELTAAERDVVNAYNSEMAFQRMESLLAGRYADGYMTESRFKALAGIWFKDAGGMQQSLRGVRKEVRDSFMSVYKSAKARWMLESTDPKNLANPSGGR